MQHRLIAPLAIAALLLTGCSAAASSDSTTTGGNTGSPAASEETQAPPVEPLDLTGAWKQTNSKSADSYQAAMISADTIEVNWVNDADSTTAIYWVGTYLAPTDETDTYSWESQADTAALENALLGSQDPTKTFTYSAGVLSYELTAMGVTMTVEMQRQ
jgi:hypothetical protein